MGLCRAVSNMFQFKMFMQYFQPVPFTLPTFTQLWLHSFKTVKLQDMSQLWHILTFSFFLSWELNIFSRWSLISLACLLCYTTSVSVFACLLLMYLNCTLWILSLSFIFLTPRMRRCCQSAGCVSCLSWAWERTSTLSLSSWRRVPKISPVTCFGANPMLPVWVRLYRLPAWWVVNTYMRWHLRNLLFVF